MRVYVYGTVLYIYLLLTVSAAYQRAVVYRHG